MTKSNLTPSPVEWGKMNSLPYLAYIRSKQGHQTIDDARVVLLNSSPLWQERETRIDVHALSSPRALSEGLEEAISLCCSYDKVWVIALVRGGGPSGTMDKFADTLLSKEVRPLLERLAPRLIFAAGHAPDVARYEWLRPLCLAFGDTPSIAAQHFVARLSADAVFQRAHQSGNHNLDFEGGLPLPKDLYQLNIIRETERLIERVKQRYKNRLDRAPIIDDRTLIEIIHRGGILMGFKHILEEDYRALAFSEDYILYQSDSFYDLSTWKNILELAGLEDWEINEALSKADEHIIE